MSIERGGPSPEEMAKRQASQEDSWTVSDAEHISKGEAKSVIDAGGKRRLEFTPEALVNAHKKMTDDLLNDLDKDLRDIEILIQIQVKELQKERKTPENFVKASEILANNAKAKQEGLEAQAKLRLAHENYVKDMRDNQIGAVAELQEALRQAREQFNKIDELISNQKEPTKEL